MHRAMQATISVYLLTALVIAISSTIYSVKALSMRMSHSNLDALLSEVRLLSLIQQRAVSSIVGGACADAATRPVHWLYDRKKLESTISDEDDPAFYKNNLSPFYNLPIGRRSCYNDISYCMLRSLPYSKESFTHSLVDMFSAPSEYAEAMEQRLASPYDPANRLAERKIIHGPWQQASITKFLECHSRGDGIYDGNPDVKETDGLCCTIPLITKMAVEHKYITNNESREIVEAASILSSNPFCIRHTLIAGIILQNAITHGEMLSVKDIKHALLSMKNADVSHQDIDEMITGELDTIQLCIESGLSSSDAIERFGKQCANPGSFQGSIYAILTSLPSASSSEAEASTSCYADAVRKTIRGGGCNCSRANFVGSVTASITGIDGIPYDWLTKTDKIEEILRLAIDNIKNKSPIQYI